MSVSPSNAFVRRTRNPDQKSPVRFERIPKTAGSFELTSEGLVEVKQ